MGRELRIRRADERNFTVEARRAEGTDWRVLAYCTSVEGVARAGLRAGIEGNSARELIASVAAAERRVLTALREAVASGALTAATSGRGGVRSKRDDEKWRSIGG